MNISRHFFIVGITMALLPSVMATVGCIRHVKGPKLVPPPSTQFEFPSFAAVLTNGVTIYADDGSWVLEQGATPKPPPFKTERHVRSLPSDTAVGHILSWEEILALPAGMQAEATRLRLKGLSQSGAGNATAQVQENLLDMSDTFLLQGAQPVRVKVPDRETPLYGVLALTPAATSSPDSSAKRSYRILVPQEYVDKALGAQVSVVYQPYQYRERVVLPTVEQRQSSCMTVIRHNETYQVQNLTGATWVLWLSDAPFAGHNPNWKSPQKREGR